MLFFYLNLTLHNYRVLYVTHHLLDQWAFRKYLRVLFWRPFWNRQSFWNSGSSLHTPWACLISQVHGNDLPDLLLLSPVRGIVPPQQSLRNVGAHCDIILWTKTYIKSAKVNILEEKRSVTEIEFFISFICRPAKKQLWSYIRIMISTTKTWVYVINLFLKCTTWCHTTKGRLIILFWGLRCETFR